MSNPYLGQVVPFGGNFAIRGWAKCDGQLLSIAQNQALFSILGTTYGGDGRTTFALPDLRGRAPMHEGDGPGLTPKRLGQKAGTETVTLNTTQMPSHNHIGALKAESDVASSANPNGRMFATPAQFVYADVDTGNVDRTFAAQTVVIANSGGSLPHNNVQPFQVINYLIATQGLFPPRN